jgi:hypothetical protein
MCGAHRRAPLRSPPVDEPWSDQLVLYALLLLLLQAGAIFIPNRVLRLILVLGCFVAIWGMAFYVWSLPPPDPGEGADIGGGIMVFWGVGTVIVLVAAAVGEIVRFAARSAKRDVTKGN